MKKFAILALVASFATAHATELSDAEYKAKLIEIEERKLALAEAEMQLKATAAQKLNEEARLAAEQAAKEEAASLKRAQTATKVGAGALGAAVVVGAGAVTINEVGKSEK